MNWSRMPSEASKCWGRFPRLFSTKMLVRKLSVFIDESGSDGYRPATPAHYRLSQVADYICTMELTALKYADKAATATDEKFFGSWAQFKKGILKELRAKRMGSL